jgi:two-component system sensor histidine kinase/response regulator
LVPEANQSQVHTQDKAASTTGDLSILPTEWLNEFFQALKKGRSKHLLSLIDQIRPEHADLARALAELVHLYPFDKLIPISQEAFKENDNAMATEKS